MGVTNILHSICRVYSIHAGISKQTNKNLLAYWATPAGILILNGTTYTLISPISAEEMHSIKHIGRQIIKKKIFFAPGLCF